MDKKTFFKVGASKKTRTNIILSSVLMFVSGAITMILVLTSWYYILDVALLVGLGVGVLVGKSRACAVLATVYFAFSKIIQFTTTNVTFASVAFGLLYLALMAMSIPGTFGFKKEYDAYLASQAYEAPQLPEQEV